LEEQEISSKEVIDERWISRISQEMVNQYRPVLSSQAFREDAREEWPCVLRYSE